MNLKQQFEDWVLILRENELSKNTIRQYSTSIFNFLEFLNGEELNKSKLIQYKEEFLRNKFRTANSINIHIVILNKFIKYLFFEESEKKYHELKLKELKQQKKMIVDEAINHNDFARMIRAANKYNMQDIALIIKILTKTGIRVSELKYFTFENLKDEIVVENKGKIRYIPIRQDLKKEIKLYCKNHKIKSGFIFVSPKDKNKMIATSTIFRKMKKVAGLAKIKKGKISAHKFRRYFAKSYLNSGGNTLQLQDIMGHSSSNTTRVYTQMTKEEMRNEVEKVKF